MEETKTPLCIFFFLFILCLVGQGLGKRQSEALGQLYEAKLKRSGSSILDKTHFDFEEAIQILPQEGLKERDRIQRLPGQPTVEFSQFGGYVTVNETAGRAFYYYFVEAQKHNKHSLPLLLWLNGGPGCSSLAYGAMEELGPFRVHSDGKTLYRNIFSWNHAANVLFLESPAGVGFSYSNTTSDIVSGGDKKTASDNYVFLMNWLERFPEYKSRDFYIAGESYAGHYVPQLAHTILHHNKKSNKTLINLKGIIIGNAAINSETDARGRYDYLESHALISEETLYKIRKYCDLSPNGDDDQSEECFAAVKEVVHDIKNIDIYSIYAPLCLSPNLTAKPKKASVLNFDPCTDYYVYAYLNRPDVQEALHANVTKLNYDWEPCSVVIQNWTDSPSTILPLLREFMDEGLRVWVFSGDTDGRIPVTSTKYSIKKMNLSVKIAWHPWFVDREVGGYTQVYKGDLTFATVRGAGHEVPSYEPARALSLIKHFLAGTPLPKNSTHS